MATTNPSQEDEGELKRLASIEAKYRSQSARWDLDIAIFLFLVLIIVIILLFEDISINIVAPIAIFGLLMVWLEGWHRGKNLYKRFYEEELARAREIKQATKNMEETVDKQVQKALRERWR